jgi:hypothetical protein
MEDPAVWRVAAWLVTKHGADAPVVAHRNAAAPPAAAGPQREVWVRVTKAALELLREHPRDGERVN